ncbi:hemerythrin domain-containing protein [Paenibacillus wynnii]|uniref:hemerythrin domain-containing protein n=1 Tax=Paenibacillus wynnii TaxID=268407 RepID=UPI00278FFF78|nr:hemerythrin domain-containing protein [Paenibacillus wynnii]MDQ0195312.1 hemerythrin-like domain-containing protein [Paenibacillus wynnii]
MMNKSELRFTKPAIRILENEHRYLTYLMEEWHAIVLLFEREKMSLEEGRRQLEKLRNQITNFMKPLKNHTDKEDRYFFPVLGNYIGLEQGPIVGIQEEHREIDGYIGHFLHYTEGNTVLLSLGEIQAAVKDAGEAFEVLTVHFMKEENVLFEMAETQITEADHKKLSEKLNSLIT